MKHLFIGMTVPFMAFGIWTISHAPSVASLESLGGILIFFMALTIRDVIRDIDR